MMKNNKLFIFVIFAYLIAWGALIHYYQHQINTDGVAYISIAEKYLRGDFANAVNGYWGPMISWLLVPFFAIGLPHLFAVKMLSLFIGLLTIIGVRLLSDRFAISGQLKNIIFLTLIPVILDFSFRLISPDLLLLCFLVYYLYVIFDPDYSNKAYSGILCGIIGALAYLTKIYTFYFFIAHFLLFNLFHYLRCSNKSQKKNLLRGLALGLIVFFIVISPWAYLISKKYHQITIGTTSRYTYANAGPRYRNQSISSHGFQAPPNPTALSFNEDPFFVYRETWSPFESWHSFAYQVKVFFKDLYDIFFRYYQEFSFFSAAIIAFYLLSWITPFGNLIAKTSLLFPIVTLLTYPAGYIPLGLEDRYLWPNCILLILMGGQMLTVLLENSFFKGLRKKAIIAFFALSFIGTPLKNLTNNFNADKDFFILGNRLKSYNIKGRIASNSMWHMTLILAYYLQTPYYGRAGDTITDSGQESYLKQNSIDYYFLWSDRDKIPDFLLRYKKCASEKIRGLSLTVYSLEERG